MKSRSLRLAAAPMALPIAMAMAAAVAVATMPAPAWAQAVPDDIPLPDPAPPDPTPSPDPLTDTDDNGHTDDTDDTDEIKGKPEATSSRHTSATVADAPTAADAHGMTRKPDEEQGWRAIPRTLLYVPRAALWLVNAPLRGTAWAYERYRLRDRWKSIFFNDQGTAGIYPVAFVETGFGFNAGARVIHRDLFGSGQKFKLRASFGGRFEQIYSGSITSGDWLGDRTELELEAEYALRPKDRFFGIGNNNLGPLPAMPVDPREDGLAFDSRFGQNVTRLSSIGRVRLTDSFSIQGSGAFLWKNFGAPDIANTDEVAIENIYRTDTVAGFEPGVTYLYNELELRYDTRRSLPFEVVTAPSTGWNLAAFTGLASGFDRGEAEYFRYGLDLQRYMQIDAGPRVLVLRTLVDGVAGDLDKVPFTDLPRLGGPLHLRGYDQDRFRDRVAALASAEYQFDLNHMFAGFLFVDSGRVYGQPSDLELEDLRTGYGGGVQIHTDGTFLGRMTLASSSDGGFFFHLSFDPVYDPKARVERK